MSVDQKTATALGFHRPRYMAVERERRWLCHAVPRDRVAETVEITDVYITGTRMRLRAARPLAGGPPMLRLTRKVDVDARTRLLTSIYLPDEEFAVLAAALTGPKIVKLRHRLQPSDGVTFGIDEFQGSLGGLILAEAEFDTDAHLAAFPHPDFAIREVTDDERYTGGLLAIDGLPAAG